MPKNDFRKARWGMTRDEVDATESTPLARTEDGASLRFLTVLLGIRCDLFYNFVDNELRSAGYVIDQESDAEDVDACMRLHTMLTKKYGQPQCDSSLRNPFQGVPQTVLQIARAVAAGDMTLAYSWETKTTRIELECTEDEDGYNAYVLLKYFDSAHMNDSAVDSGDVELL